jgi:CrcB protein
VTILLIALFGVLGVLARYSLAGLQSWSDISISVLTVNAVGSFLAGFVANSKLAFLPPQIFGVATAAISTSILVGFLGGLTTFSAFALDTSRLIQESQWVTALTNVLLNNGVSVILCFFGLKTASYVAQV